MLRKKSLFKLIITCLVLCLSLTGCSSDEPTTPTPAPNADALEKVPFTIAFCTWVGYAPLYIAQDQGYFDQYGINPTLTIIEDESQYAAAMYSNSIQALGNVLDREVIHFAKGTPEELIFAMCDSQGGDGIVASADIQTVADLKGKTIGLDKSSTAYFFFLTVLKEYDVNEEDLTIQEMGASDAGAAFVAGHLDAAVVWEPWLTNASQREGGHVLVSSKEYPHTIVDVMAVRTDFAEAHPDAVTGLTKAWYDAIEFYKANPEQGNAIMAKGLDLNVEEIAEMMAGVVLLGKNENLEFFDPTQTNSVAEVVARASQFWIEKGIIDTEIDSNALISSNYYKGE